MNLKGTSNINGGGNSSDNILKGNNAQNQLRGGAGNDTLNGGDGDDLLWGDAGSDLLVGEAGNDHFCFGGSGLTFASLGQDVIADFAISEKLVLSKATFTALQGSSSRIGSQFAIVATDAAVGLANALIVFSRASGKLFYNENGLADGLGAGGQFAHLSGVSRLGASNFVLVD